MVQRDLFATTENRYYRSHACITWLQRASLAHMAALANQRWYVSGFFLPKHFRILTSFSQLLPALFLEERDGEEINTDREKDNPGLNSYTPTSSDMPSPPILLNKKKLLKREKSRVQFFIENDPPTANRPNDRQRLEDSPTESWKSEYSGTDLRQSQ